MHLQQCTYFSYFFLIGDKKYSSLMSLLSWAIMHPPPVAHAKFERKVKFEKCLQVGKLR